MIIEFEIVTSSEEETLRLGGAIGGLLRPRDVVLLIGELGTGKTRLAKGMVSAAADVNPDEVVSPTFTLINCFDGKFQVCHADLYRITPEHLEGIGLEDALDGGAALIVEWAEKIAGFNEDPLSVFITYCNYENLRRFRLAWREDGAWNDRIEHVLGMWRNGPTSA